MNTKTFSKEEAVRFGWGIAKGNIVFFIEMLAIIIGVTGGLALLSMVVDPASDRVDTTTAVGVVALIIFIAFQAISIVVGIVFELGTVRITLDFVDKGHANIRDLFMQYRLLWRYFLASLLYNLIVFVGFILLVVPGIIWALKFQFYSFAVVDENAGVLDSFRRSAALSQGVKWNLLLFWLVLALVGIAGFLALGVGLLWAIPTIMVARAFLFRTLVKQTPSKEVVV